MLFDVVSREGKPLCAMGTCALCEKTKPLHALELWRGQGQKLVLCDLCTEVFEGVVGDRSEAA